MPLLHPPPPALRDPERSPPPYNPIPDCPLALRGPERSPPPLPPQDVLPAEELAALLASNHRPNYALEMLSTTIDASTTVEVSLPA